MIYVDTDLATRLHNTRVAAEALLSEIQNALPDHECDALAELIGRLWDAMGGELANDVTVLPSNARLAALDRIVNLSGGEFARIESDGDGYWFVCHKCGELIDGTEDLDALECSVDGFGFRCSGCGQEYIGSTCVMLHAIESTSNDEPKGNQ